MENKGLYKEVTNGVEYKDLTWDDIKASLTKYQQAYWDRWDTWWVMQPTAFQEEFDRVMKLKVKEYCDEV